MAKRSQARRAENSDRAHCYDRTSSASIDKTTGCITSLLGQGRTSRDHRPRRMRQSASVLQGHAEAIRRVEHRSGHARCTAADDRKSRLALSRYGFEWSPGDPRHPPLAELEVCPDHHRSKATSSTSTTTSTGTRSTCCSRPPSRSAVTSDFATYEIPYGTIERPTTRNNSWEKAQFEVPAMRWADLSGADPTARSTA